MSDTIEFDEPTTSGTRMGGVWRRWTFANGRGASVIRHDHSHGGPEGLWELAVLDRDGHLDYSTPVADDVIGWLTDAEAVVLLQQIAALPPTPDDWVRPTKRRDFPWDCCFGGWSSGTPRPDYIDAPTDG